MTACETRNVHDRAWPNGGRWTALVLALPLAFTLAACGPKAPPPPPAVGETRELADGWVEVRPEANLSLKLRDGWSANRAQDGGGPIVFTGPRGAQVIVWPVFVANGARMPPAPALLAGLARQAAPDFQWSAPAPLGGNAVRMFGQADGRVAQATFAATQTNVGVAGAWYLTAAPQEDYAALRPVFAGLMSGVRIFGGNGAGPGTGPGGAQGQRAPETRFVRWQEPNEGAYVTEVPEGWQVRGGIKRPDPMRLLDPIDMQSPDGQIYVFSGDHNGPIFKTPTQMELQMGMREGSMNGAAILARYHPATDVIADYVPRRFGQQCGQVQMGAIRDQPEISGPVNQQFGNNNGGFYQHADVALGEFRCGQSVGMIQLATYISGQGSQMGTEGFGIWMISGVAGFIAPAERANEAGQIVIRLLSSRQVNPQWARGNQQMVAQIQAISHDAANQMSAQIASRYSPSSGSGSSGSSSDDLSRRWQNNTMDQTDVIDPTTGERYKVESGSNYYWINQAGTAIAGTNAPSQPSVDFSAMTQLP